MFKFLKKKKVIEYITPFKVKNIYEDIKLFKYDVTIKMVDGETFTTVLVDELRLCENEGCLITGLINSCFKKPLKLVILKTYLIENMEDTISVRKNWKINKVNWGGSVSYEAIVHVLNSDQISSIKYEKSVLESRRLLKQILVLND